MHAFIAAITVMMWGRLTGLVALLTLALWVRSYYRKKEQEELARSAGTFEAAEAIKRQYRMIGSGGAVVGLIALAKLVAMIFAHD
jgi:hypothetical protein